MDSREQLTWAQLKEFEAKLRWKQLWEVEIASKTARTLPSIECDFRRRRWCRIGDDLDEEVATQPKELKRD